ncbi:MAG: type I restriction enzyme HsdR N-terminal domain-containing protein [Bacteroidales bacterium]|nr:type I restriction enzyme HsdR N-terminal domain-containing protein [Bacteroidales bacterium]
MDKHGIRTRITEGKKEIFDPVRCRYIACTPEEIVRQTYLLYLIHQLHVPKIAVAVEKQIIYNHLVRRYDIVVFSKGKCLLIAECKAPSVELSEDTLSQIAAYNSVMQAKYIVLFNGRQELICKKTDNLYLPCEKLPVYSQWTSEQVNK